MKEEEMAQIEGIVPVLVTPLKKDGEIDETGLEQLLEFLVSKPIGGLWALGTGSEDMNLVYSKRLKLARLIAGIVKGRVPIMLGASFFALEEILSFMGDAADLEVDAFHVMPYHPLFGLDRLEWFYKHIAKKSPKPLWMYTSANWCRMIPPEFVEKMKGTPNIVGVKYSTSNTVHISKVLSLADKDFQVIPAVVKTLFPCLCLGARAFTTSEASPLPEPIIKIYELYKQGKYQDALDAQRKLNSFLEDLPAIPSQDNFLKSAEEKTILYLRGLCEPYTTNYYRDATDKEMEDIKQVLKKHKMPPFSS